VGTIKPGSGGRLGGQLTGIDTPTLRGLADTGPYLHDGSAPDLPSAFNFTNAPPGSPHAAFRTIGPAQQDEILRFLLELDGSEPAAPVTNPVLSVSRAGSSLLIEWPMQ